MTIFGKSLKSGKIWTNFEQYFLPRKIRNGKICWNLWRLEKSFKKCEKNFGKSLKSGKIWTNFEQYFLPCKIRNGKFFKNMLEFVESGKIILTSVKK